MKPFNSDVCCWSVCLSASKSNLVSVFLCSSTTKSLSYWIPYSHSAHNKRGSQGRAAYQGNLYSHLTDPDGITAIKACQDQRKCCQACPTPKATAGRTMESSWERPCSSCNQEGKVVLKHKEGQELPRAPTIPHVIPMWNEAGTEWGTEYGAVLPICRLSSLNKGKEQSVHLVSGSVQVNFEAHASSPRVPAKALHRWPQASFR